MKTIAEMLRELVAESTANFLRARAEGTDETEPPWAISMVDMWTRYTNGRLSVFTAKQAAYIRETHEKVFDDPIYTNDFSAGRVPLGSALKTAVPDVLKKPLPKKPPGRT
jgi:hypothetical protein